MAKEKTFMNVISMSDQFQADLGKSRPETQQELYRWFVEWQLRIQLGMLQQLTMISQHVEKAAKAMADVAAEVERTASQSK